MAGNWTAPNPPFGAVFTYNLKQELPADTKLVLTITDETGKQVRRIDLDNARRAEADRVEPARRPAGAGGGRGAGSARGRRRAGWRGGRRLRRAAARRWCPAGRYTATLGKLVGDKVTTVGASQTFRVVQIQQ